MCTAVRVTVVALCVCVCVSDLVAVIGPSKDDGISLILICGLKGFGMTKLMHTHHRYSEG